MKKLIVITIILIALPSIRSVSLYANDTSLYFSADSNSSNSSSGKSIGDFLNPDGSFDLEAARRSDYQGSLKMDGFESIIDPATGKPVFKPTESVDAPSRDHPDDIYWDNSFPCPSGVNDAVSALTVYDGKLIAGGYFAFAGCDSANYIASWDGSTWSPLGSGMNSTVLALTVYDNSLIAGGHFTTAGGTSANKIASWDGSTWSPLGSGMVGNNPYANPVYALTVYDGNLIAGGYFTTAGGTSANNIASWDGSTWSPLGSGMDNRVYALTVYNGSLIAGGYFTTAGGTSASRIASWDGSTWSPLGSGVNDHVHALTVYNDNLIAGGDFYTAGGAPAGGIASWNGTAWSDIGWTSEEHIEALTVYDGQLIVDSQDRVRVWNGSTWSELPGSSGDNLAFTVFEEELIIGGYFLGPLTMIQGIASWDGMSLSPVGSGMRGDIDAVTEYNSSLIACGSFYTVGEAGETIANNIASWDGSAWSPLGLGMDRTVSALTVFNGELIAGGYFTTADGTNANKIASWNGSTWSPLGSGMNGIVYALTVYDGSLIAGGSFTTTGGIPANKIASWDGLAWSPLGSGMNSTVLALTVYDGNLIAGGYFTTAGGTNAEYIASWDGSAWSPLGLGMNNEVNTLTVYDGGLIAGGNFTTGGGTSVNYIASWDGSVWSPLGPGMWNYNGNVHVYSLTVYNGQLIAGGQFDKAGGTSATNIASWDGLTWSPLGSGIEGCYSTETYHVNGLSEYGSNLIVGGFFEIAGNSITGPIAEWTKKYDPDTDGDGVTDNEDNCPNDYNPAQSDSDSDNVGDLCDNCPDISNSNQMDGDNDEIGDACDPGMAVFSADFTCGVAPLTVQFLDESIATPLTDPITDWHWEFGDGATSDEQHPTHVYESPGFYTVTLAIGNDKGWADLTMDEYVEVKGVDLDCSSTNGVEPLVVTFWSSALNNADEYLWDFGDGFTSDQWFPYHRYSNEGVYTVSLTITIYGEGCEGGDLVATVVKEDFIHVDVSADFTAFPHATLIGESVQFQSLSSGSATDWQWDFGDGSYSADQHPTHIYQNAGWYDVSLTATGSVSSSQKVWPNCIQVCSDSFADLWVELFLSMEPRPGFIYGFYVEYGNSGLLPADDCELKISFPADIMDLWGVDPSFINSGTYSGYTVDGGVITIPLSTVEYTYGTGGQMVVYGSISVEAGLGESVEVCNEIESSTPDENIANNSTGVLVQEIVGSIDPNDKYAYPGGESLMAFIAPEERIYYKIIFENKPEATADAIYAWVIDTLDANLDWSSLSFGPVSHPDVCSWDFDMQTGVITWFCDSIWLPPNQTPPEGEGYVSFSISPKADLPLGTEIANEAYIRFDFNPWLHAPDDGPAVVRILADTTSEYICGDVNNDQGVDILDIIYLIDYKFKGGPEPIPLEAANVDGAGGIDILDIIYLIDYKFKGGPEPNCP